MARKPSQYSAVTSLVSADKFVVFPSGATRLGSITLANVITSIGISSYGATLIDDANAAAARTTLGLGTAATSATGDFEASGAVSTHAALTSSVHGISSFGATLIDDADASAARTTLGLGTAATSASSAFEASGAVSTHAAVTSGVHGISAFAATFLDDADASAVRTTLGLGTAATSASSAFEASGAVSTHAALTSSVHGISSFGATLVDDADASTARTTLGLGSIATQASSNVAITGGTMSGVTITGSASLNVLKAGDTMTGLLQFSGTTHAGLQLNNLTTTQRNAIASPAAGMTIWDTTQSRMCVYNGSAWTDGFVRLAGDTMTGALTISQGTITASTPLLDLSSTFNNGAVTFTAVKLNVTDTASASGSLLMDLQRGGTSQFRVDKNGNVISAASSGVHQFQAGSGAALGSFGVNLASGSIVAWSSGAGFTGTQDLFLYRDAANTLALRNGTNAQTFNVYNTYTDASNYERVAHVWSSGIYYILTQNAGTGSNRKLVIGSNGSGGVSLFANGGERWNVPSTGHFIAVSDNTHDIGAAGATRPRYVHVATTLVGGINTPAQITSNQNNYNPGTAARYLRLSTDASRDITGLTFTVAQVTGQEHIISNVGSTDIVLKHESASSTAANRFTNTTAADITLTANQEATVWYDGTSSRWRVSKRN